MSTRSESPSAAPPLAGRAGFRDGLAAAIVPSLAVALTASAALWLSAAVLVSLFCTAMLASLLAGRVRPAVGSLGVLLAAAVLAGTADIGAGAWLPEVGARLGIYLPLAIVLTSGPVSATVLADAEPRGRPRRAAARALGASLAFLGGVTLTALAREALGAGTITLPRAAGGADIRIPGLAEAPARGVLTPSAGLIAAGYLAGLAIAFAQWRERRRGRKGAP